MAIVKHIKSRNANYSAAINYLLFEHDEKTGIPPPTTTLAMENISCLAVSAIVTASNTHERKYLQ